MKDVLVYSHVTNTGLDVPFYTPVLLVLSVDAESHLFEVDWQVVDDHVVLAGISSANKPL